VNTVPPIIFRPAVLFFQLHSIPANSIAQFHKFRLDKIGDIV